MWWWWTFFIWMLSFKAAFAVLSPPFFFLPRPPGFVAVAGFFSMKSFTGSLAFEKTLYRSWPTPFSFEGFGFNYALELCWEFSDWTSGTTSSYAYFSAIYLAISIISLSLSSYSYFSLNSSLNFVISNCFCKKCNENKFLIISPSTFM